MRWIKGVIVEISDKIQTKILKSNTSKIKSLIKTQLRKKENFGSRGLNPGRLGTSPPI